MSESPKKHVATAEKKIQLTGGKSPVSIVDEGILSTGSKYIVNAANDDSGSDPSGWTGISGALWQKIQEDPTKAAEFTADWHKGWETSDLTGTSKTDIKSGIARLAQDGSGSAATVDIHGRDVQIIHAVGPRGPIQSGSPEETALKNTYLKSLELASKGGLSVALPPLGIGAFKVQPETSAKCAAEAIKEFNKANPDNKLKITMVTRGMHSDEDIGSWVDKGKTASNVDIFQLALRQHLAEKDSEDYQATTALLAKIKKQQSEAEQQSSPLDRLAASWPPPQIIAEDLAKIFIEDAAKQDNEKVFKGLTIAKEETAGEKEGKEKTDVFKVKNKEGKELAIVSTNSISFPPIDGKFTDQQAELAIKCFEQLAARNSATLDKPLLLKANNFEKEALESLIKKCQEKEPPIPIKLSVPGDKEGERKEVELFKKAPAPAVTTTDNPNDGVPRLPEPPTTSKAKFGK